MHAGGTVPPNNTHAGGTVPPNNTNPGICYLAGPLKIPRALQNIVKHISAEAALQRFCPYVRPSGTFEVVCVIHTLTSLHRCLAGNKGQKCLTEQTK